MTVWVWMALRGPAGASKHSRPWALDAAEKLGCLPNRSGRAAIAAAALRIVVSAVFATRFTLSWSSTVSPNPIAFNAPGGICP